jgi:hypothetical protein
MSILMLGKIAKIFDIIIFLIELGYLVKIAIQ